MYMLPLFTLYETNKITPTCSCLHRFCLIPFLHPSLPPFHLPPLLPGLQPIPFLPEEALLGHLLVLHHLRRPRTELAQQAVRYTTVCRPAGTADPKAVATVLGTTWRGGGRVVHNAHVRREGLGFDISFLAAQGDRLRLPYRAIWNSATGFYAMLL